MKSVLLVTYLFLVSAFALAQPGEDPKPKDSPHKAPKQSCLQLAPVLKYWIAQGMFQGNLLLVKNGEVLCESSVGFSGAEQRQKILTDSRFPIASLSKPIVASLVLKLQEKGIVDLQSTIDTYLPEFAANWKNKVTLHHLLSNRAGLPGHFALPNWQNIRLARESTDKAFSQQDLMRQIASMELKFEPGSDYLYTNLGWSVLEEVVVRVTGKSLQANLQELIFKPLSMQHTGMVMNATMPMVHGLRWGNVGGWQQQQSLNPQVFNAGAGLYSTTWDVVRFLEVTHSTQWLSAQSRSRMFDAETPYGWRNETLSLASDVEKQVRSYDGQLQGHSSFVYNIPEDQLSLVILNNTGMGFTHKKVMADEILRAFYQLPSANAHHSPSLLLNRSLLDNQWSSAIEKLSAEPIVNRRDVLLLNDLAQQLDWSGNARKSIDVYSWLSDSFPEHAALKAQLARLCANYADYDACEEVTASNAKQNINVGMKVLALRDTARKAWRSDAFRPITTHIFYPTTDNDIEPLMLGPAQSPFFKAGDVVIAAQTSATKRPLILMSHGTGGSALQMLWLAEALVKEGYLVAAVNHHGNTAYEQEKYPEGFLLWWERAQDLAVVRQQLLKDEMWGAHIDASNAAVVGFSLGGYTALSALGGITDKALFTEYCQQAVDDFSCKPQPEFTSVLEAFQEVKDSAQVIRSNARQHNSYQLPALKAAVAIAPAVVHAFEPDSLRAIKTPTLFIVGDKDKIAPAKPNSVHAHSLLPNSQLFTIKNGHHYSFLSQCTAQGKKVLPQLCDEPNGISRQQVHRHTVEKVLLFLREHLQ